MAEKKKIKKPRAAKPAAFPSKAEILEFIQAADDKVTRREVARAFKITGDQRVKLKAILRELTEAGLLMRTANKALAPAAQLPKVTVVRVVAINDSGTAFAQPEQWEGEGEGPRIRILDEKPHGRHKLPAIGEGDRLLVRIEGDAQTPRAKIIKRLEKRLSAIFGVYRAEGAGGWIEPVDKKVKTVFMVPPGENAGAADGELVRAEPHPHHRRQMGPARARILEKLGNLNEPRSISLIAIHAHDIPTEFPSAAIREAEAAQKPVLSKDLADLRDLALITIDPADARDHDDALWAEPDPDPENAGGWHVIVAIADVARYVTPDSALDREARLRGNSCYFPDRVVPMLPEALSNDLCSLKAGKDRASLAAHLYFSADGQLKRHKFVRGLIRVAANISYEEAQAAIDGKPNAVTAELLAPVLQPLYAAYAAVAAAREARGPLKLDLPERKVILDQAGDVAEIALRARLDAHRLVEDFMIAANVAAAEALERAHSPLIYRGHGEPSMEKIEALGQYLEGLGLSLAKGQVLKPVLFNRILDKAVGQSYAEGVNDMVLRSQMQAIYTAENIGHFGLALPRYAHFTSPIRRYADLIVHRALIRGLGLGGPGGLTEAEMVKLDDIADHISKTERRAMAAERDSTDRYMAAYYGRHKGEVLQGRVAGVARFGLFIRVEPGGGDGFVPAASIGKDYYVHDEARQAMIGERSGDAYIMGDPVAVRIVEADPISGGLRLELVGDAPSKLKAGSARRARGGAPAPRKPGTAPERRKKKTTTPKGVKRAAKAGKKRK